MWACIFSLLLSMALAQRIPFYDHYKVYRVVPQTESQLNILLQIEDNASEDEVNIFLLISIKA